MLSRIKHFFLALFIFTCIPIITHAAIYNVPSDYTFQAALTAAAESPDDDIINLQAMMFFPSGTLIYPAPYPGAPGSLTIQGPSPTNQAIINGNGTFTLLYIDYWYNCCYLPDFHDWGPASDYGTTLTIRNVSFQNGHYPDEGYQTYAGALSIQTDYAPVLIEDCTFTQNSVEEEGAGGLYVVTNKDTATTTIQRCDFINNQVPEGYYTLVGGAMVYSYGSGTVTVNECLFQNNDSYTDSSSEGAGGLFIETSGNVVATDNNFYDNDVLYTYDYCAGGAYIETSGSITFEDNSLSYNSAGRSGGAYLYGSDDTATVSRNTFSQNSAWEYEGGGLTVEGGEIILSSNFFSGNTAFDDGGAAYVSGPATIVNNIFVNNSSAMNPSPSPDYYGRGGALYAYSSADTAITNNTFIDNSAYHGGAVYARCGYASGQVLNVYNNIFWGNAITPVAGSTLPDAADLLILAAMAQPYTVNLFNNNYTDAFIDVIEGATLNQAGNITADPMLIASSARLTSASPCMEMGLNSAPGLAGILVDIDGDPRIADNDNDGTSTIDMGADEYAGVLVQYTLSASVSGGNGIIFPTGGSYLADTVVVLTATPDTGYQVASWSGTNNDSSTSNTNAVTMNSDKTVSVTFELIPVPTYTITATAGAGGSIDPDGATTINEGETQAYTIAPDTGYHTIDVLVDGVSQGAITTYTFPAVDADHTISATFAIDTFTITASSGAGGSISPAGAVTADYGSSQIFSIEPETGYYIEDVLVDGASVGAVSSYEFTNITASHIISATFAIYTYTIAPTSGPGGSINPSDEQTVEYGDNVTFTILPGPSYDIADVLVDGSSIGAVSSYEFTNVTADHTIHATFAIKTFTISVTASENGSVDPAEDVVLNFGGNQGFTFTPNTNYHVADVLVDGASVGSPDSYQFNNVQADHTLEVVFAIDTFTITSSSTIGGSIDPDGSTSIAYDGSPTFTITPDTGYHIDDVVVDGSSVGAVSSYEFVNVTADHTIYATFALDTFTITASAGAGGSILPGTETATYGSNRTFTIAPNTGYHITDVLVDGSSVGAVTSYTFTNITADHNISATFAINDYTITAVAGVGGTISPAGDTGVSYGGSQTFTITSDTGYYIADVLVDGVSQGAVSSYIFSDVGTNHTISASFALDTFTITTSAGAGGSISPTSATVTYGGSRTFTITPDAHYHIADVLVNSTSVGAVSSFTIENVTADATIAATFAIDTYTLTVTTTEGGSVVSSPAGDTFDYGTEVQLTATPDTDYMFDGWNGDVADPDAQETTVIMDADKVVSADFVEDADSDGVPSEEEQGPDGTDTSYDGNGDDLIDSEQANVVSGHTSDAAYYITLASPDGTSIVDAVVDDLPESAPEDYEFPFGLISFAVDNVTPAGSTTMEIYLPAGQTCNTYYKYDEASDIWEEFLYDEATGTGAVIDGNKITLHFVDGQRGDQDGAADGIITDPGTPGISTAPVTPEENDDSGSSGGGCFIDTADSGMSPFIAILILLVSAALLPAARSVKTK